MAFTRWRLRQNRRQRLNQIVQWRMKTRSANIGRLRSGAIFLSSLYLFLLGAASFCMFVHAAPPKGENHHTHAQQKANHSTLCVWACQVGSYSSTGQIVSTPEAKPDFVVVAILQNTSTIMYQHDALSTRSRAPPRSFLFL